MPIDFTQLHAPASANTAATTTSTTRLLSNLSLRVGQPVAAEVTGVRVLTGAEKQLMQAQASSTGARPSSNALNAIKPELATSLLQQSSLKLVNVKIQAQQVALLSALPLAKGDSVWVNRVNPQKLEIMSENGKPVMVNPQSAGPKQGSTTATASVLGQMSRPEVAAVQQTLREILPRLQGVSLEQQSQSLQLLSKLLPHNKLANAINESLKALDKQAVPIEVLRTAPQNIAGVAIKQAVNNSGTFFEANLMKLLTGAQGKSTELLLNTDRKAILLNLARLTGANNLAASTQAGSIAQGAASQSTSSESASTHSLAQIIKSLMTPSSTSAASTPASNVNSSNNAASPLTGHAAQMAKANLLEVNRLLPSLSQAFLSGVTAAPQSAEAASLQTQLMLLTHQLSLNSLAKIRGQQLGADPVNPKSAESVGSSQQFAVDLPVRWGEQTQHARISFEPERDNVNDKTSTQAHAWLVKLHINTEAVGDIYVHIRYCNEQLGLGFWAQDTSVLQEAKAKLETIRQAMQSAGLAITQVNYFQGKPAGNSNELSYNLVDVKT
ncbi:flagellar hook-length control protein FliK [Gilvimarinus agarilyticus]|uniref:flagellar hook-length control protein FliK n=1 Tax=Gilvimarinus sp. 2_MG-2023 TaxID=3062666 RepID=UPI001C098935|nr:flagellar hook-length control protein FliK [Gilvimarinus sp. 2_MG-2023]MBU2887130.1 flagellar hook-length control protein FliK [Gilvimarinus agarilyticus]MDO6571789.1 flagellar hook-length control protein FliK [Gilvimarinus sp. 2_MG-2023]